MRSQNGSPVQAVVHGSALSLRAAVGVQPITSCGLKRLALILLVGLVLPMVQVVPCEVLCQLGLEIRAESAPHIQRDGRTLQLQLGLMPMAVRWCEDSTT